MIRACLQGNFRKAAFAAPDMMHRIMHNAEGQKDDIDKTPDNPHQRISEAPVQMSEYFTNLVMRGYSSALTAGFVAIALYQNSVPVEMLNDWGTWLNESFIGNDSIDFVPDDRGAFYASLGVIGTYLSISMTAGSKIGKDLTDKFKARMEKAGDFTKDVLNCFKQSDKTAISKGHEALSDSYKDKHGAFGDAWKKDGQAMGKFIAFLETQTFLGSNIVSLIPAVASLAGPGGKPAALNPFQAFVETQRYVTSLLESLSYLVFMMPQIAEMKAQGMRVAEMAKMFERAADKKAFYSLKHLRFHLSVNRTASEQRFAQ